jgi:hypothetical protein
MTCRPGQAHDPSKPLQRSVQLRRSHTTGTRQRRMARRGSSQQTSLALRGCTLKSSGTSTCPLQQHHRQTRGTGQDRTLHTSSVPRCARLLGDQKCCTA